MLKLFKYELRKTRDIKVIMLCITAILEVFFLIGLYGENERVFSISCFFLFIMAFVATVIIGVHSMKLLKNDLNTKQAYMLFMTPNNSYKILGAKVIENGVSIFLAGAFFFLLGVLDMTLILGKYGGLSDLIEFVNELLAYRDMDMISVGLMASYAFVQIAHWLYIIAVAFFAIVLSATFFNGKKWNSFASLGIFIAIVVVVNVIINAIFGGASVTISSTQNLIMAAIFLVLSVIMYFITAWIMDNSLSV
ncbi:hypothetical protein [Pseudobutyrivibrio sp.]|uniref:hypothetical protein n=1 Tax=Pseudobutyrivibrio sp. TaxID=2014367 RepID=UPI0025FDAAF6|nr:hypothetical protein [Pseudobutyrivibrio sp.]MBR5649826.1 hypothetical protein [Pseudobutyrivibrio sp.]